MARRVLASSALALVLLPGAAYAQAGEEGASPYTVTGGQPGPSEQRGAIYLSALVNLPWSQGLTSDEFQIYVLPPGGLTVGWSVLGGVLVAAHASVEFEFARTGILERTEPTRYGFTYHEERRDNFFTTAVRIHTQPHRALEVEPVFGFDVVKEETWSASERVPYVGGPVEESPRYKSTLPAAAGFSFGADLRAGAGRTALVVAFRAHRTFWGGTGDFDDTKQWTIRPGVGLRFVF